MEMMLKSLVQSFAILNPIALSLYLAGVMEELDRRNFARVLAGACIIFLLAACAFALAGEALLVDWLGVCPEAPRTFGGTVFFIVAYDYIVKGYKAVEILHGSLSHLPSAIALPFMIGAGTITQSILVGKRHAPAASVGVTATGVAFAFLVVFGFKLIRGCLEGAREELFDKYANILARLNGLLIGAISTGIVVSSLRDLWQLDERLPR